MQRRARVVDAVDEGVPAGEVGVVLAIGGGMEGERKGEGKGGGGGVGTLGVRA